MHFYFSSHSRFLCYRSNIPIRGHEALRPKILISLSQVAAVPHLRAKYLSQVAAKTPSLLKVPSAGWVAAPPWGRGREHFPGGSLHRCVVRPSTEGGQAPETPGLSSGDDNGQDRDRGSFQDPTHQKGTAYLVCAPQVVALAVAPTGKRVSRLGIGDPTGSRHPAPHFQAAGSKEGPPSRSWPWS